MSSKRIWKNDWAGPRQRYGRAGAIFSSDRKQQKTWVQSKAGDRRRSKCKAHPRLDQVRGPGRCGCWPGPRAPLGTKPYCDPRPWRCSSVRIQFQRYSCRQHAATYLHNIIALMSYTAVKRLV